MVKIITIVLLLSCLSGICKEELEVEFRYSKDGSRNVDNQYIKMEKDEVEISEGPNSKERAVKAGEFEKIKKLVHRYISSFKIIEGEEVKPPFVWVKFEYEGEDREIEIGLKFHSGKVPKELVDFQKAYFKNTYK